MFPVYPCGLESPPQVVSPGRGKGTLGKDLGLDLSPFLTPREVVRHPGPGGIGRVFLTRRVKSINTRVVRHVPPLRLHPLPHPFQESRRGCVPPTPTHGLRREGG